jgi:hypothetical protein
LISVLFPDPLSPTSATNAPGAIVIDTSSSSGGSPGAGAKDTCRSSIAPVSDSIEWLTSSSSIGSSRISWMRRCAAVALTRSGRANVMPPIPRGGAITVDYATFCGPTMEGFACACGHDAGGRFAGTDGLEPFVAEIYGDHASDYVRRRRATGLSLP